MSAQLSQSGGHQTNVIPLRTTKMTTQAESAQGWFAFESTARPEFADLVSAIEGLSYQLTAERAMRATHSAFDAVYISALAADQFSDLTIGKLKRLARIQDRSHELIFDDGMD